MSDCLPAIHQAVPSTDDAAREYRKLTDADKAQILRLRHDGLDQKAIARALQVSQPTISRILGTFADTSLAAKARAKAASLGIIESMTGEATAPYKPSTKAAELVLRAADLLQGEASVGTAVQVVVNMPRMTGTDTSDPPTALITEAAPQNTAKP